MRPSERSRAIAPILAALKKLLAGEQPMLLVDDPNRELDAVNAAINIAADVLAQRLADSERLQARQAAVFDALDHALIVVDGDGVVESVNRAASELLGEPVEALRGRRAAELVTWPREGMLDEVLAGTPIERVEVGLRGAAGAIPISLSARPASGGAVLIARDRRDELTAQLRVGRLQQIVEASTDFIGIAEPGGCGLYLNPAGRRMIGVGPEEDIRAMTIADVHPPWSNAIIESTVLPTVARSGSWQGELALLHRDGREIPVSGLVLGVAGEPPFLSVVARDMRANARGQRNVLDALPELVFRISADGVYLECHESEYSPRPLVPARSLLGKTLDEVLHEQPELARSVKRVIADTLATGQLHTHEYEITLAGAARSYDARVVVADERSVYWVVRDVSESRRQTRALAKAHERLEASNAALEAFAYSVSHDLRAPLGLVEGFSRELRRSLDGQLSEQQVSDFERIGVSTERLRLMIDGLLELSRHDAKPLRLEDVDVSAMAHTVVDELRALEPARGCDVTIEPGLMTAADPGLLYALLKNLLDNAWKFSAGRDPSRIQLGRALRHGEPVFFVRDNGAGFDPSQAERIFLPFRRLTNAEAIAGAGLGLATVRRVVARHGGGIWAEGQPGQGASFYFSLTSGAETDAADRVRAGTL